MMNFSKYALALMIASQVSGAPSNAMALCADYFGDYSLETCSSTAVLGAFNAKWQAANDALPNGCPTSFFEDLRTLIQLGAFGVIAPGTPDAFRRALDEKCAAALESAIASATTSQTTSWDTISNVEIDPVQFFMGGGFLNLETGNFQQDPDDFPEDQFIYRGDDPRLNDHYPTTERSYQAGVDVNSFQANVNEKSFLTDPLNFGNKCQNQAIMCCWHRDRQYKDNNGNCNFAQCVDKDPADNTNLCWTEDEFGDPTAYPGDGDEGNLHCHGLAWGEELESVNDFARFNNLFYVSLFDHMYTRGYVESVTANENIANIQPMCGCVEEMNPVSRADCTEAVPSTDYLVQLSATSFEVAPIQNTFSIEYQACEGAIYDSTLGPEDFQDEVDLGLIEPKTNDLSAFVFRLFLEGKMTEATMFNVYDTLVGYENPNANENEQACARAFGTKFNRAYG